MSAPGPAAPPRPRVVRADSVPETGPWGQGVWTAFDRRLTAAPPKTGRLGAVRCRVPPGCSAAPAHTHAREDEFFYVLEGRGVFRTGDRVVEIGPGDAMDCPCGTGVAHQIANPFDADLVYLAVGIGDPHEVCTYPDSGQVSVRALDTVGRLEARDYHDGQPDPPPILTMPRTPR